MKKPIKFLTLIFSLSVFVFLFSSCYKDKAVHNFDPSVVHDQSRDSSKNISFFEEDLLDFEGIMDDELDAELGVTLAEALESIDPDVHPDWGVAIKAFTCIRSGQTLVVYNPNDSDLDFYDSRRFAVYWFKDGKPLIRNTSNKLECVCKGRYAVIILSRATLNAIGIAFYTGRACYLQAHSIANTDF